MNDKIYYSEAKIGTPANDNFSITGSKSNGNSLYVKLRDAVLAEKERIIREYASRY